MKIAVVGPSPVPYVYGGAEGLMWRLTEAINKLTPHQAELIKLPSREHSFWELIDSYHQFYDLDLSHFDLIISTKYPSWMVRHQNHVVYMVHHLRGLFDTYQFCNQPETMPQRMISGPIEDILGLVRTKNPSEQIVEEVFERLDRLEEAEESCSKEVFNFPGPFIREIIHFFDAHALSPQRIKRYVSISENLKHRADYFPPEAHVVTAHPPSKIDAFQCKDYEHLFTVSRLDGAKRINLLVEAMRYVPHNIKLKIAGTGPDEEKLRALASKDDRIEFLGFVNDESLVDHYSHALAVPYVPYDEDYGLITIEAMMSRKPVITANDSGGTLEFVEDGKTGYLVEPDPQKIAERINNLVENQQEARRMGDQAMKKVKSVTWEGVVTHLLGKESALLRVPPRAKILVLATYSCYPPQGGGQHRIYNLYSRLAKAFDVTVCSIIEVNKTYQDLMLNNGLTQISVPQSKEHANAQWEMERELGINLYDVCMIDLVEKSEEYVKRVRELADDSDIIVFSHPYLYGLRKCLGKGKLVVYEAHNVEYFLKKDYINRADLVQKVKDIEQDACSSSDLIFATSTEEGKALAELYSVPLEKIVVVPNGVDTSAMRFASRAERTAQKMKIGINSPTVLFVGSWHPPNLEALTFITDALAKKLPGNLFLVVGSIKEYYLQKNKKFPKNVLAFGVVDEEEKYELYKLADLAINPMFSGSGTNLKMLDYMSAGIPVVSTQVGARGIDIENHTHALVCPAEQFLEGIKELAGDAALQARLSRNGRTLVEERYSWDRIAKIVEEMLQEVLPV